MRTRIMRIFTFCVCIGLAKVAMVTTFVSLWAEKHELAFLALMLAIAFFLWGIIALPNAEMTDANSERNAKA